MKNICLLLTLSLSIVSCRSEDYLQDFYYSFSDEKEGAVYKYASKEEPLIVEYAQIDLLKDNRIKTIWYNNQLVPSSTSFEKYTDNGTELYQYSTFLKDEKGETKEIVTKIEEKDIFKWDGSPAYTMAVSYNGGNESFKLKKTRCIKGFEHISIGGVDYRTAVFNESITIQQDDTTKEYQQKSFFVPRLGMIKYLKEVSKNLEFVELELVEILTPQEFEALKATKRLSMVLHQ